MNSFFTRAMVVFISLCIFTPYPSFAVGGISIQGTRLIYPKDKTQISISVDNSSNIDSFLVQSWVEDTNGNKTDDFIVTPPLYLSKPGDENSLHLIKVSDRGEAKQESLYYFVSKAIPSIKQGDSDKNLIRIATATRIKMFLRPTFLNDRPEDLASRLKFSHVDNQVKISNPTPYYVTLTKMTINHTPLKGVMVAPGSSTFISVPLVTSKNIFSFRTINDFGVLTAPVSVSF